MPFKDTPIRFKLPSIVVIGLFLFAGVVLLYTMTLHKTITAFEHLLTHDLMIRQAAQDITIQMLQARRAEKDFLLRKEVGQIVLVDQSIDLAIKQARQIGLLSQETPVQEKIAQRLILVDHLTTYRSLFKEMASEWKNKGFTYQDGKQKIFYQVADHLEENLQKLTEKKKMNEMMSTLMLNYHHMRRLEKDYLINQEVRFVQDVERLARELRERVQESSWSGEEKQRVNQMVMDYWAAFEVLVSLDQTIDAKMLLLRETIHKVEPLVDEIKAIAIQLAYEHSMQTRKSAEKMALLIFVGSLVTILLCGFLSIYMIQNIVRSIGTLWTFAHEVATGNLEAKITPLGQDEMGHLAQVLIEMVNRMRAIRLIADRMVMILALISRGAVPDKINVEFHGDFQKISNALNEMIGRMGELRLIATQIDRIGQGEIPDKLTGPFQGDFKRINDAMNTIIDKLIEIGGWPLVKS